jgi:ABC-type uncharacterized transport system ATPase component
MPAVNAINQPASSSAAGVVELATNAEAKALQSIELAITPAALGNVLANLRLITFDGRNGAGACTLAGAVDGDLVVAVAGLTEGALGDASASFEAIITVNDQIQQSAAGDLSAKNYLVLLLPTA